MITIFIPAWFRQTTLPTAVGVQILFLFFALFAPIIFSASFYGIFPPVSLSATKGAAKIATTCITGMGEK